MRIAHPFAVAGLAVFISFAVVPAYALEPLDYVRAILKGDAKDDAAIKDFPSGILMPGIGITAQDLRATGIAFGAPSVDYQSAKRLYISVPYNLKAIPFTQRLVFFFKRENNQWQRRAPTVPDLPSLRVMRAKHAAFAEHYGWSPDQERQRYGDEHSLVETITKNRKTLEDFAQWAERVRLIKLSTTKPDDSLDINYDLPGGGDEKFHAMVEHLKKLSVYFVETHTGIQLTLSPPPFQMEPYRMLWIPKGLSQDEIETQLDKWERDSNLTGVYSTGDWLLLRFN